MRIDRVVLLALFAGGCGSSSHATLFTATSGPGALSLVPAPLSCPACAAGEFQYEPGTAVSITPVANPGAALTGWGGACAGAGSCTVRMDGERTVVAAFARDTTPLAVQVGGDGAGNVSSDAPGIDCGSLCMADFTTGSTVTLTATAAAGSTFAGWFNGCQGTGSCSVLVDRARSVSAVFRRATATLTVQRAGPGTVYSAPAGIACGAGCVAQLPLGSSVTLVATPDANATFAGWGGACGASGTCLVTLDAAKTVTAQFVRPQFRVLVATAGTGTGTVLSSPAGISCGASCAASFDQGSQVVLVASPNPGSMFQGWSGDCTGLNVCALSIVADKGATATFAPAPPGVPQNPLPALFAVTPNSLLVGSTGVTLTLTGQNFVAASVAFWAGQPRATQLVDGNTLRMTLLDADLTVAGNPLVTVGTPVPGGGVSSPMAVWVSYPAPALTSINPALAVVGSAPFQMALSGTGFVPVSRVTINGWDRPVTYGSATQLLATIDANLLSTTGAYSVIVTNGSSYGAPSSASLPFTVGYAVPTATSIFPASAVAGSPETTVVVRGASFVNPYTYYGGFSGSAVRWNGANLTTTFISANELRATVPAALLAAAGTAQLTVFTAPLGGGTSAALPFSVQPAPPRIASLQPDSVTAGATLTTLAIHGNGFTTSSTVTWNGAARTATFIDATQLQIPVAAADVSSVGSATIAVSDPSSTLPAPGFGFPILAAAPSIASTVQIAVSAKDLAWDPGRRRIYASVPSSAPAYGNSIVAIDVDAGTVSAWLRVGSEPGLLSLSDDRSKLYVALDGASLVERVDVAAWQVDLDIPLGSNLGVIDLQAAPGNARTVAISRKRTGLYSTGSVGIIIYDDAVPRSDPTLPTYSYYNGVTTDTIAFAAPDVLYSFNNETSEFGLRRVQLLSNGTANDNPTFPFSGSGVDVRYDSNRLYATTGGVADLGGAKVGTFALPAGTNAAVVPDWIHGRVFFLSGASLLSYTASTFVPQGSLTVSPASSGGRFLRWDTNGIAYRTATQVVLVRSSLVGG